MSTRNINQGPTYIDPLFEIPDGLVNFEHGLPPDGDAVLSGLDDDTEGNDLSETEADDESYIVDEQDDTGVPIIDFPDTFSIVSQTIRTMPNGMQVIDVVVATDDIPGATNYEFRIVKT
jgi:hypothetical protein